MFSISVLMAASCLGTSAGDSALHVAVREGDAAQVQALVTEAGALIQARNDELRTPLHVAVLQRRAAICKLLLAHGATVGAVDSSGRTPLHYAALTGQDAILQALLEAGANPRAVDQWGETPLHTAARRFRLSAAELLTANGADLDARNLSGQTPLHLVSDIGSDAEEIDVLASAFARLLLARGADANAADLEGVRPLDSAVNRGHLRLAEVIREHGGTLGAGLPKLKEGTPGESERGAAYRTYTEIGAALAAAQFSYPDVCQRVHLGYSVQGRDIWALHVTDNVGTEEDEPEFSYISTMHGDEWTGNEMCLYLIDELTTGYGIDPRITHIIDEIDLWIVPLMNPDGFDRGSPTRANANGLDLNRNFPDPYVSPDNTPTGREPETGVIMNWRFGQSFTLSANLHTGALVANYPYDTNAAGASVYTASPDDDLFIWISKQYSQYNLPMWTNPSFPNGITNGADWYAISGGMQDWNYTYLGCNEITLELSNNKIPPATQIPQLWNENRESMLAYIETCLVGTRGLVTDAGTGLPLAATVSVVGRDHEVYTDPDVGDYHRMLLPGTYDLAFSATGYDPVTLTGVSVPTGDAIRADVVLGPPAVVVTPNGGQNLAVGVPTLVEWTGQAQAQFQVQRTLNYGDLTTIDDDFESGLLAPEYQTGGNASWLVTTSQAHSGIRSARAGAISDSQSSWLTRTVTVAGGGAMSFWYRVSSESGYDYFSFYIDGVREVYRAGEVGWTLYSTVLGAGSHELRWEYVKDGSVSNGSDTAWIDDLQIVDDVTTWQDIAALTDPGATSAPWTPQASSASAKVRVRAYYVGGTYGYWDESDAVFAILGVDCNGNGTPDDVDIQNGTSSDCNDNGIPDECDIADGTSLDIDGNGVPDECEAPIPATSEWGFVVMTLLLLTVATLVHDRRQSA